jgi:hypothetical protein
LVSANFVADSIGELQPDDEDQAGNVAVVVSQVFGEPVPAASLTGQEAVLEALQAGIAGQLAVLDDASLTGTGQSSADVLEVPGAVLAAKLTTHLLWPEDFGWRRRFEDWIATTTISRTLLMAPRSGGARWPLPPRMIARHCQ